MFIETLVSPRSEWEEWSADLRVLTDPPKGLLSLTAWESGNDEVTACFVWEEPSAVADFFVDRIQPLIATKGEPKHKPERPTPIAAYVRPS